MEIVCRRRAATRGKAHLPYVPALPLLGLRSGFAPLLSKTRFRRVIFPAIRGILCFLGALWQLPIARAQFVPPQFDLSDSVHLDEADSATRAHLERVKAYVDDGQWDEAVETLRQVMETQGGKVVPLTPARYVSLADFCHLQIAALPADALALYRARVDSQAAKWYEESLPERDAARLQAIVDQMFCSSWGDDALWALGEIELERGNRTAARANWEKLIQQPPPRVDEERYLHALQAARLRADDQQLLTLWYQRDDQHEPPQYRLRTDRALSDTAAAALVRIWNGLKFPASRLAYPGTSIPLAEIRARLALVSILEGNLARAKAEVALFTQLHPDSEGQLAGRQTNLAKGLAALVAAAEKWPTLKSSVDWPTFAGNVHRNGIARSAIEIGAPLWPAIELGETVSADLTNSRVFSYKRTAEDAGALLSYFPAVVGNSILLANQRYLFAFDLQTGPRRMTGVRSLGTNRSKV